MISSVNEIDLNEPGVTPSADEAEQNLLFLGTHSATGRLMVQFIQGDEAVGFEIARPELRTQVLSLLIDAVGEGLAALREEAGQA